MVRFSERVEQKSVLAAKATSSKNKRSKKSKKKAPFLVKKRKQNPPRMQSLRNSTVRFMACGLSLA